MNIVWTFGCILVEFWMNFGWNERKWKEMKGKLIEWILGELWVNFGWNERKWKEVKGYESKISWKNFGWIFGEMKGNERKWKENWLNEFWVNCGWILVEMKGNERKWKEMKAKLVEWILGEFWVKWKEMNGNERKWKQNTYRTYLLFFNLVKQTS